MYTLYYSPGTASMVVHLALLEIGAPYQLELVDFKSDQQPKALPPAGSRMRYWLMTVPGASSLVVAVWGFALVAFAVGAGPRGSSSSRVMGTADRSTASYPAFRCGCRRMSRAVESSHSSRCEMAPCGPS